MGTGISAAILQAQIGNPSTLGLKIQLWFLQITGMALPRLVMIICRLSVQADDSEN